MDRLMVLQLEAGGCPVEAQLNGMPVAALPAGGGRACIAVHEYTLAGRNQLALVIHPAPPGPAQPAQPRVAIGPTWARARLLLLRKGQGAAHWSPPGDVALPLPRYGEPWALRESVLLHELAHHLAFHTHGSADHGPSYTACMLDLVARALGEEAAFALRVDYGEHQVV